MTMTVTTPIEDGSNMCQASGRAGMSDGVMTPRKNIGNLGSWLRRTSGYTVRRQYVEICAKVTNINSIDTVSTGFPN